MVALATVFLILLSLTGTASLLPDSWEASLWQTGAEPEITDAVKLPAQPVQVSTSQLSLGAKGVVAIDIASGTVLFAKAADRARPIASIVKLATATQIVRTHKLDEVVTVGSLPSYPQGAVILGLKTGQRFTVGQLLAATLVPSANDAADALAIYDSGSIGAFAAKRAGQFSFWGIKNISLTDANGLSDSSMASPAALAKLAELALRNPDIKKLAGKSKVTVKDLNGISYPLISTNQLLSDPRYSGIKTGYTEAAGQSVVSLVEINGHQVITVILGSPDRFGETRKLVSYLKSTWSWQ